jgi:hypothetical protein
MWWDTFQRDEWSVWQKPYYVITFTILSAHSTLWVLKVVTEPPKCCLDSSLKHEKLLLGVEACHQSHNHQGSQCHILFISFYFWGGTGVGTQGLTLVRQVFLLLEPLHQPIFVTSCLEIGSRELFSQAGFELDHPDLCLLSTRITGMSHWHLATVVLCYGVLANYYSVRSSPEYPVSWGESLFWKKHIDPSVHLLCQKALPLLPDEILKEREKPKLGPSRLRGTPHLHVPCCTV